MVKSFTEHRAISITDLAQGEFAPAVLCPSDRATDFFYMHVHVDATHAQMCIQRTRISPMYRVPASPYVRARVVVSEAFSCKPVTI